MRKSNSSNNNNQVLLSVEDVSKFFPLGEDKINILKNINLKINKGDFLAIMGPSGSGKSTLMYIMGCLDKPTAGKVIFEGQDLTKLSEKELAKIRNQKIGFVFQMFNLLARTSALTNVELPMIYSQTPIDKRRQRAAELLIKLGLSHRLYHHPSQLSGGEQQRIAIARALVNNPTLILADEPTGNLDSKSGKEVLEIFKRLNQEGKTIVLVTHDPKVAKIAKKIARIQDGRII